MTTRFLITNDLHQSISKWRDLVRIVSQSKPRFVLITGDILPKEGGFNSQRAFFPELADYLAAMRGAHETTILTLFGNDDFHPLEPFLDELAAQGLCVNMNGKVHRQDGFVFCGMSHVRDYPFGYKHWCAPDGDFIQCPIQFCGEGLTVDATGQWSKLQSLRDHLLAKPSLLDRLGSLRAQLSTDELHRSIWLVHNPPANLGMDICSNGSQVGSPNILRFIHETRPLLGCSGHIHESPYQPGGQWAARVGPTLWLQPGQDTPKLHHVTLEVADNLEVSNITHSILGSFAS